MASNRKNERIAEIIRQKDVIMKMLKERVKATGIILQDHELKYKAEKAWREVKRAGITLNSIAPVAAGMLEHQIADSQEDVRRKELNLDPMASSQRPLVDARDAREDQMLRNDLVGNLGLNPEVPLFIINPNGINPTVIRLGDVPPGTFN